MIRLNWLARAAGSLVFAVPLVALSAPPPSVPYHGNVLQNDIFAGNCIKEPEVTTCLDINTYSYYDILTQSWSSTYFDVNESRYLPDVFTLRRISCSMAVTTLKVDGKGATLATTLLDPSSVDCSTSGFSLDLVTGDTDNDFGGFTGALTVSGAFSSPEISGSANQTNSLVNNSTGARSKSTCVLGGSENFLQGGFFINGAFFAAYGGPSAFSRSGYAKCVVLYK